MRKISGAVVVGRTPRGSGKHAQKQRKEMWLALEQAFEEGKARAIGVSNYQIEHLEEMREYAKVWPPHVSQIFVSQGRPRWR